MRKCFLSICIILLLAIPVQGAEYNAPVVPESGQAFFPEEPENFTDGLMEILQDMSKIIMPSFREAVKTCVTVMAVCLIYAVFQTIPKADTHVVNLVCCLAISVLLLGASNSLIHMAVDTIGEISDYGKLLLPVMTAATAAQGGVTVSTALYTGTAFFDFLLSSAVAYLLVPLVYTSLALSITNSVVGEEILSKLLATIKSLMTWGLKIVLYLFTAYMSITGVVSGTVDATTLKATKLTISGMVPVVGGVLSDASETILVGAGIMKNAAGVYGILAMLSIIVGPFVQIGGQYLALKLTTSFCASFGSKESASLLESFTGAMGILLAMTGTVCLLFLISTICFMKGSGL